MVATSRKAHGDAPAIEPPVPIEQNLRALYDHLRPHLGQWRVDAIDGGLVVSPLGTPDHQWMSGVLTELLAPVGRKRGWRVYPGLDVVVPGSRHPYTPDFAMGPRDAPRWGDREVFTDGLVLVGEIVSKGSTDHDRKKKPGIYAKGGVPVMLLIDPLCDPATVTVFSGLEDGAYTRSETVQMGNGLHIPDPVGWTMDTAAFLEE